MLVETFVETPRYTGAVYRASGWIHVGTTQGRIRTTRNVRCCKAWFLRLIEPLITLESKRIS